MNVESYISELLFSNDCVIVPGFGGFVGNYAPAKIHPVNHTFYPPSKSILFNSKLLSDDGLLLHAISIGEGISYDQAKQMVDEFVHDSMHLLNEDKSLMLERIGKLRKDIDGRFLFDPDSTVNYLEDSFGLSTFVSPPVLRSPMHKRIEKKFTDRRPTPVSKVKNKKIYWAGVVLLPVLLLTGWILLNPSMKFKETQQTGVVNIFETTESSPELNESVNPIDSTAILSDNIVENTPSVIVPVDHDETNAPVSEMQKPVVLAQSKYYVIGGAFKIRENADNMLAVLRTEGYQAEDAGQNPAGLYMVSYFSSINKSEAMVNLETIRSEKNPSAWLLKK
jgi:hypothetical protein